MQVALYGRCVFWRSWLDVGTIVWFGVSRSVWIGFFKFSAMGCS